MVLHHYFHLKISLFNPSSAPSSGTLTVKLEYSLCKCIYTRSQTAHYQNVCNSAIDTITWTDRKYCFLNLTSYFIRSTSYPYPDQLTGAAVDGQISNSNERSLILIFFAPHCQTCSHISITNVNLSSASLKLLKSSLPRAPRALLGRRASEHPFAEPSASGCGGELFRL